jgi:hypothetical protein
MAGRLEQIPDKPRNLKVVLPKPGTRREKTMRIERRWVWGGLQGLYRPLGIRLGVPSVGFAKFVATIRMIS